ncbi:MAG: hypothetical protein R3B96_12740 [Pirellulaceae bacterium]
MNLSVAKAYLDKNQSTEVELIRRLFMGCSEDHESPTPPIRPALLLERAELKWRYDDQDSSIDDLTRYLELAPTDHWRFACLPRLRLLLTRPTEYRRMTDQATEQFRDATNVDECERIAKILTLSPPSDETLAVARALIDRSLAALNTDTGLTSNSLMRFVRSGKGATRANKPRRCHGGSQRLMTFASRRRSSMHWGVSEPNGKRRREPDCWRLLRTCLNIDLSPVATTTTC